MNTRELIPDVKGITVEFEDGEVKQIKKGAV